MSNPVQAFWSVTTQNNKISNPSVAMIMLVLNGFFGRKVGHQNENKMAF